MVVGWCVVGGDSFHLFCVISLEESKVEKISRRQLSRVQFLLWLNTSLSDGRRVVAVAVEVAVVVILVAVAE